MDGRTDRFLTRGMALALAIVAIFSLTFSRFQVKGDGLVYYNLLRRFFGEHPDFAFAYQFGSDVWNAPFFLVGKGLAAMFGFQPKLFHVSFEEISMSLAAQTAFIATLYLGWRLLRELDLPRGPFVLLATAFGSPLFYYVFFEPAAKHAVDTLVITAAALLVAQLFSRPSARSAVALGALAGVSLNVRYVNVAFFLAIACGFALRNQFRTLGLAAASAVIVGPGIFALPALRGIPYFVPAYFPKSQAAARTAAGVRPLVGGVSNPLNGFDPVIPLKMLFSEHRGLFLWSPLTALATIGFVLTLRREALPNRRAFLWTLAAAALALLCVHTIWGQWDGGFAYSQRFLTSLFPLFLIGVAELRRGWGRRMYATLTVCIAWSLAVAFVHDFGYDNASQRDGIVRIATVIQTEPTNLWHKIDRRATERWRYFWGLLHQRDPKHPNGS